MNGVRDLWGHVITSVFWHSRIRKQPTCRDAEVATGAQNKNCEAAPPPCCHRTADFCFLGLCKHFLELCKGKRRRAPPWKSAGRPVDPSWREPLRRESHGEKHCDNMLCCNCISTCDNVLYCTVLYYTMLQHYSTMVLEYKSCPNVFSCPLADGCIIGHA